MSRAEISKLVCYDLLFRHNLQLSINGSWGGHSSFTTNGLNFDQRENPECNPLIIIEKT